MSIGNKFYDGERKREEILKVIDYYIETNNIIYINDIEEKERENNNQVSENKIIKE